MVLRYDLKLIVLFLALFLSGIQIISEPIKIVPYDLAFLCIIFVTLLSILSGRKICVPKALPQIMAVTFIMLIWLSLQALRSPDVVRAFTLLGIAARGIGTMILVAIILVNWNQKPEMINRIFFMTGFLLSIITIPLFLLSVSDPGRVISDPRPGLIYRAGEGLFPHFQGFNHNPIYFATLSLLSMAAGLTTHTRKRSGKVFKIVGLSVLFLAAVASFQRGPFIALTLGLLLAFLLGCFYPKLKQFLWKRAVSRLLMVVFLALPMLVFVRLSTYETTLLERLVFRFQEARWQIRLERWLELLTSNYQNLWIGHGLRSAELTLGAQVTENSYVEILYEQGVIGLLLWIVFFGYILLLGVSKVQKTPAISMWVLAWLTVLVSMAYVTMHYDPLTWIVAGVIVGWKAKQAHGEEALGSSEKASCQG